MSSLDEGQIRYAKKLLKKMHPLYNLEIELCLPFLDPVIGVTKRCFGYESALKKTDEEETVGLADADGLKDTKDGELKKEDLEMGGMALDEDGDPLFDFFLEDDEDPIGRLGYGVVSYFSLIYTMMCIFALITIFFIPVMRANMSWKGYDGDSQIGFTAKTTLGNLGASASRCTTLKLVGDVASIGCQTGTIAKIQDFGVYAKDSEADLKSLCSSTGADVSTGVNCPGVSSTDHPLYTDKLQTCVGQQSCIMKGIHDVLPIDTSGGCELTKSSTLYIQYSCEIDEDELEDKRRQALYASCTTIFSCLVLLAVLKYRQGSISIEKKEWDLQTVTASDYTVEIKIYQEQFDNMKRQIQQENFMPYESEGLRIKLYLQKVIEEKVKVLSDGEGGRVSDINFGYKNAWLLDMLIERGDHIKFKKWDKLNALNKEMTRKMHEDMENLTTPVCAFICMESEDAYNHIAPCGKLDILGKESTVKEAVEPTNIIWQNRYFNKTVRAVRMLFIIVAVSTVLFITFLITTYAKGVTNDTIGKYDDSIKCSELANMYDTETLQKLASDEWIDYYKNGGEDLERLISTDLSCFCSGEYARVGSSAASSNYTASDGTQVETCGEFFADRATVGYIAMAVSMMIVGVNFVLKVILVELIKSLRLKTVTAETNYTMIAIFIGQFMNTAVIVVLNNASFHDFDGGVGPLSQIFRVGTMTDFSVVWYKTVGTILMKAMLMAGLWPLIEFTMFWSMITFFRCLDKNFGSDPYFSNSPSIQAYIDTWSGPIYLIHYRYATILLQIGVAFCYGSGMPLLYFYAFLAYLILYVNERLLVCYYYREPPAFDEKMTMLCIDFSKYVPYIMLPMAFWQLGNRQIFENETYPITFKSDIRLSGHTFTDAFSHMDPRHMTYNSAPLWVFFALVAVALTYWILDIQEEEEEDDQLVEGLENYFDACKPDDRGVSIGQEETMLKQYNVKTFSDQQFADLKNGQEVDGDKIIMGVATYRILESLTYQQFFQYEPAQKKADGTCQRDDVIIISTQEDEDPRNIVNEPLQQDVTYLACNLAYIPEKKRTSLNFDTSEGKSLF